MTIKRVTALYRIMIYRIMVWEVDKTEKHEFISWKMMHGLRIGNHFVSETETFAFTWNDPTHAHTYMDKYGNSLLMTNQAQARKLTDRHGNPKRTESMNGQRNGTKHLTHSK